MAASTAFNREFVQIGHSAEFTSVYDNAPSDSPPCLANGGKRHAPANVKKAIKCLVCGETGFRDRLCCRTEDTRAVPLCGIWDERMTENQDENSQVTGPAPEVVDEIHRLNRELRAFVAVALQHGLRDYCEARHPELTAEIEKYYANSERRAKHKYDQVLTRIGNVPELQGTTGETRERTYYRSTQDNVAYIEHALKNKRFVLGGIWVAPPYRGKGVAHNILRVLVESADEADLSIELYHEPFGAGGLVVNELEAFYNRHGFTRHQIAPDGMVRFPRSPLDLYRDD